jgi:quercetin dioxygenase-like cupin family protein
MAKRRDLLTLAGIGAIAGFFPRANAAGKLTNSVAAAGNATLTKETFGDLRIYFDGPTDQLKSMTAGSLLLKPGQQPHPPHQHEEEEFMVVTEGTGEFSVEGKVTKAGPATMLYSGGNKLHGIVNTGSKPLMFYFYKWKA